MVCSTCKIGIGKQFKTEYYNINSTIYCSVGCYTEHKPVQKKLKKRKK